ncbi:sensor histidine kinase [Bacillus songklensis]|uniref:histidine kinase n=1 Tax=Bacillus songklensis TaxID=1069116 RepID=A0ABV8B9Q5_9BACI
MQEKWSLEKIVPDPPDLLIIQSLSDHLQLFADLFQCDVFIDCLVPGENAAFVVAEAHPKTAKSLYKKSVAGQIAQEKNEPGVLMCLKSGKPILGSRGISQENINIQQNVIPIKNDRQNTIGVLIMEKDITDKINQEKKVRRLSETNEQLTETLFELAMSENRIPALIHEGLILFNNDDAITYANERAYDMLRELHSVRTLIGSSIEMLSLGTINKQTIQQNGGFLLKEFEHQNKYIQLKAVSINRNQQNLGGILLLRDLTEIKEKEKQLMIKSAVIKEIHHRVKNNLQTIAGLLRLQMRRSSSKEVEQVFRDSINRITSISIVHEVLSQDGLNQVDCKEIFEYVSRAIVSSMKRYEQTVKVKIAGDSIYLNADKASSLALVVNELVQNCMEHAFFNMSEGYIVIQLEQRDEQVVIQVTDNGVGIGNTSFLESKSLGLDICTTLIVEDLDGTIEFTDTGNGTQVTITFPYLKEGGSK